MNKFVTIILLGSLLCSCGVKGDLYLPGQAPHNNSHDAGTLNPSMNKESETSSNKIYPDK